MDVKKSEGHPPPTSQLRAPTGEEREEKPSKSVPQGGAGAERKRLEGYGFVQLKSMVRARGYSLPKFVNKGSLIDTLANGKKLKGKGVSVATSTWRLDTRKDVPYRPLDDQVPWEKATGCHKSDTGHGGVFFVKLPKGVVVLKACSDLAQQVFASTLISWLGITTSRCRVLDKQSKEAQILFAALYRLNRLAAHKLKRMRYILVMEYFSGVPLKYMTPKLFKSMEAEVKAREGREGSGNDREGSDGEGSSLTYIHASCLDIGYLGAADALLYYDGDRTPFITRTRGNGGNIILTHGTFEVRAIDNGFNFIEMNAQKAKQNAQSYFTSVRSFILEIKSRPKEVSKNMSAVSGMITRYTRYEISKAMLLVLQQGFLKGVRSIVSILSNNKSRIRKLFQTLRSVSPPLPGVESLNEQFLQHMLGVYNLALGNTSSPPTADIEGLTLGEEAVEGKVESPATAGENVAELAEKGSESSLERSVCAVNSFAMQRA